MRLPSKRHSLYIYHATRILIYWLTVGVRGVHFLFHFGFWEELIPLKLMDASGYQFVQLLVRKVGYLIEKAMPFRLDIFCFVQEQALPYILLFNENPLYRRISRLRNR